MKKINYKVVALVASTTFLISGCETMQKASSALGSTGTGVIAGVVAGAGTGIACDKLTGGKNTGACVAAGMAVGAAVGTWAASIDEAAAKKEPPVSCDAVKKSMNYSATETKPFASLKLDGQRTLVVKPNEKFLAPVKADLASSVEEVGINIEVVDINKDPKKETHAPWKPKCGGQTDLPLVLPTKEEGVYYTTIKLNNADDNKSEIKGGIISFCYTVAKDGKNLCK